MLGRSDSSARGADSPDAPPVRPSAQPGAPAPSAATLAAGSVPEPLRPREQRAQGTGHFIT